MQESIETLRTELEERSRFETLLAETSTRFVNVPADRIDSEIQNAQRRICEFLDLDRSTLWQSFEGNPGTLLLTHICGMFVIGYPTEEEEAIDECRTIPS